MRTILHYLSAAIIIPIYGIQVCPFIESLPPQHVAVPVVAVFAVLFAVRPLAVRLWVMAADEQRQTLRVFALECGLFLFAAIFLTLYNTVVHDFPLVSGLKVLVGISALGFFTAVDLGLAHEYRLSQQMEAANRQLEPSQKFFPISAKAALFASISTTLIVGVLILLLLKDLDWLVEVGDSIPLESGQISIIKEFLFVLAVILPHALNIIYSFSRNLKRFFALQTNVLQRVTAGHLDGRVPISSNDEFGVMAKHTNIMVETIRQRTAEVSQTRDATILSLTSLAEARDNETGAHILRTQRYVRALAEHLAGEPRYSAQLPIETIDLLFKSAPLHDIGKVGIADAILLKPGKLSDEEFEIMKTHAQIGADALSSAEQELGSNSFLRLAKEISVAHHEKWDGTGYPNGLSGTDIPLSGRLMAVADVYDALISKRVYKPAFTHEAAMDIIKQGRGQHFDPDVVDALLAVEDQFKDIARRFGDENTTPTDTSS